MPTVLAALALLPLLAADSPSTPQPAPRLLPRSSIAAVLARRGELGLDDVQVKQLEERDAVLQKQLVEIRERLGAPESRGQGRGGAGSAPHRWSADEPPPPLSPTDMAREGGSGATGSPGAGGGRRGGGGHGGQRGGGTGRPAQDPAARAAELQRRLDDADTAAWLEAENLLREPQRVPARDVAEKFREALADQRDAESRRHQ
jgi:hypothetical protein